MLTPSLKAAMDALAVADAKFRESVNLDASDEAAIDLLYDAREAAEFDVIRHPCLTLEDIRAKARLAIADESVFASVSNCTFNGEHELYIFLRSLLDEPAPTIPVDESGQSAGFAVSEVGR